MSSAISVSHSAASSTSVSMCRCKRLEAIVAMLFDCLSAVGSDKKTHAEAPNETQDQRPLARARVAFTSFFIIHPSSLIHAGQRARSRTPSESAERMCLVIELDG